MSDWEPVRYAHNEDVAIAYTSLGRGPVDLLVIVGFVSHLEIGRELSLIARVTAMVQFATYARVSRAPDYPEGVPVEVLKAFWGRILDHWGEADSLRLWAPSLVHDVEARDWWARMLRSGLSPGGARAIGEMYEQLDVRPLLPAVQAPTLVLYRSGDQVVAPPLSRAVARGIPSAREVELDGSDHLFCAGDQQAVLDEIERFLTGRLSAPTGDRVLATVLFTDVVDSTRQAAPMGDRRWRDLLERHGQLVEGRSGATGSRSSRVQAAADGGEVLASSTVKDLVVGSGLRFADRGEQRLKGVPDAWRLYAVVGDEDGR